MGNAIRALRINQDQINRILDKLKKEKRWVCWRSIWDDKKGKFNKIPVNAKSGYNAKSNDKGTWHDFQTALEGLQQYNLTGLGIMLGDGLVGIDIDGCRDKVTGSLSSLAEEIMQEMNSYAEVSPSGTGLHILCLGSLPEGGRKSTKLGLEMYDFGRFFTVTGDVLFDGVIEDKTSKLIEIHTRYFQEKPLHYPSHSTSVDLSKDELINKALNSKNGDKFKQLLEGNWQYLYPSQSEADHAFCCMLAFWTGRDEGKMDEIFRSSGLYRLKWDEKHGKGTYGEMTIRKAVSRCNEVYIPYSTNTSENSLSSNELDVRPPKRYSLDDMGNAERMIDLYGDDIRYNTVYKRWFFWNKRMWKEDIFNKIPDMANDCISHMKDELRYIQDPDEQKDFGKWMRRCRFLTTKKNMISFIQGKGSIVLIPEQMDKHPWLFNCANGVIDLKSGNMMEHRRDFYLTRMSPIKHDPQATCPQWLKFLNQIMQGNEDLAYFLQKAVGYSLTAVTTEQCMFMTYGIGANGKSTFLEIIRALMGNEGYAMNVQPDTLMITNRQGGPSSDLARLKGCRLVTTVEPDEGRQLSEGLIKQVTGGDMLTARFPFGREFEYRPEFKIWMATNHKPIIKGGDVGIWRRIRLIPFTVSFPEDQQDKALPAKLRKELPGILNWAIEGCLLWQKEGLKAPKEVLDATQQYRSEMDIVSTFLKECCTDRIGLSTTSSSLFAAFQKWCAESGERPLSKNMVGRKLTEHGYQNRKIGGQKYWMNITLLDKVS